MRVLAVLLLLAVSTACGESKPAPVAYPPCEGEGLLNIGDTLPDCRFEGLAGHADVDLDALKGTPTVLNFWAGWCPNCIKEMPAFDAVFRKLDGSVRFVGLDLLGVMGETKKAAVTLAARTEVTYPLAYDRGGYLYGHFSGRRAAPVLPATVLIDATGVVRHLRFGELSGPELEEQIRTHLGVTR